jgi:hypothetical protein
MQVGCRGVPRIGDTGEDLPSLTLVSDVDLDAAWDDWRSPMSDSIPLKYRHFAAVKLTGMPNPVNSLPLPIR